MNHLQPEEYEFHQMRAAYWAVQEEEAQTPERRRLSHEMRQESLIALGMIALREVMRDE